MVQTRQGDPGTSALEGCDRFLELSRSHVGSGCALRLAGPHERLSGAGEIAGLEEGGRRGLVLTYPLEERRRGGVLARLNEEARRSPCLT